MSLADYLVNDGIIADMKASTKLGALEELVDVMNHGCPGLDRRSVLQVLLKREGMGSTGIGDGVAIPHGKDDCCTAARIVIGRSLGGCDFEAVDGKPCHVFCLIMGPQGAASGMFGVLGRVARILRSAEFRKNFMETADAEGIRNLLNSAWQD